MRIKPIIDELINLSKARGHDANNIILDKFTKEEFEAELTEFYLNNSKGYETISLQFYQGYRIVSALTTNCIRIEIS